MTDKTPPVYCVRLRNDLELPSDSRFSSTLSSRLNIDKLHESVKEKVMGYSNEDDDKDGSDLNEWVGTMLRKMTVSIEQHVHKSVKNQPK